MRKFKDYITTRFNAGLYRPKVNIRVSADEWMEHRLKLSTTFTLPSMMGQSCQNFTWRVLIDKQTPAVYRQMLSNIPYPNMRLIYKDDSAKLGQAGSKKARTLGYCLSVRLHTGFSREGNLRNGVLV